MGANQRLEAVVNNLTEERFLCENHFALRLEHQRNEFVQKELNAVMVVGAETEEHERVRRALVEILEHQHRGEAEYAQAAARFRSEAEAAAEELACSQSAAVHFQREAGTAAEELAHARSGADQAFARERESLSA